MGEDGAKKLGNEELGRRNLRAEEKMCIKTKVV